VCEEKTTGTKDAATSAAVNLASTDADDVHTGVKNDNSDDHTPDQEALGYRAKKTLEEGVLQGEIYWFCITILSSLLCREVGMMMQNHECTFTPFMCASIFYNILCFCYVFDVVHRLLRTAIGVLFNPNSMKSRSFVLLLCVLLLT
jgi:hypothetical protein